MSPLARLIGIAAVLIALTSVTPFAFRTLGDNAYIALTMVAGLFTIVATRVAERAPPDRVLWLIFSVAILLRAYMLLFDPLLSSDIYRYIWDGRVQAAGINPYRYFPADPALTSLRDATIFPQFGENVTTMRLAMLACDAVSVALIMLFLRQMNQPVTRVIAYLWHPLPLWEIANGGHVDALMVALMLSGLWGAMS